MHHALINRASARGIGFVRADANDPLTLLREINGAFEQFKAADAERQKNIDKRFDDVVTREHPDYAERIIDIAQERVEAHHAQR